MISVDDFLADLREKGINLWSEGEQLRVRAPKGGLTLSLREEITRRKAEILGVLGGGAAADTVVVAPIPPADRSAEIPLSSSQHRLWFLDQYERDHGLYVIANGLRLRGHCQVEILHASLNRLVARHESLRTVFPAPAGTPLQKILPALTLPLPVTDLAASNGAWPADAIRAAAAAEAAVPFDLATGPLLRVRLLRLNPADHVLLLTLHHIISDAWSMGVLTREISELYAAGVAGREPVLPALAIQYADYAVWQRQRVTGALGGAQLAFWREQLRDAPPLLELPWDRPRPAIQTHAGRTQAIRFDAALTAQLRRFSQECGASLYMTLLAGFSAVLARYAGQDEVVVGSPVANRPRLELEGLIGVFINTLVLRTYHSGSPTGRELLARVKRLTLDALAHQDVPFEELVEKLPVQRSLGYAPFFQVLLVLQNTPVTELQLPGLTLSPVMLEGTSAKFDLSLILEDHGTELSGVLEYNTDLFLDATIARLGAHLVRLLAALVANPEARVSQLPILAPEETAQLLALGRGPAGDYPRDQNMATVFEARAAACPESVALVFGDRQLTCAELNARANQLARELRRRGVGTDVPVAVLCERSVDLLVALLGVIKAGGAYVPLDPKYPAERLAMLLAETQAPLVLTHSPCRARLSPNAPPSICLDTEWNQLAEQDAGNLPPVAGGDHLAYIIFTSGSTGRPKAVRVSHRAVLRLVINCSFAELTAREVILQLGAVSFDASVFEIWGAFLNGGRLVVPPPEISTFAEIGRIIAAGGVTTLWLTAGLFHLMVDENLEGLRPLRQLLAGGDALSVPHCRRVLRELPGLKLINGYGPTENCVFTTCCTLTEQTIAASVAIGRPVAHTQVYLLDRHGNLVPPGCAGELYTGGAGLARDYLHDPRLTAEKYVPNPFASQSGGRLYRTGDRCRYLPDGNVEFLGRLDNQVKIRGFRIELGEIETALASYPDIKEAVVLVADNPGGDKRLVAFLVQPAGAAALPVAELRAHLRRTLPDYMVPAAFVAVPSIPLTAHGKVDRRRLLESAPPAATTAAHEAPQNELETAVAKVWAEVLRVERVGRHDNFFDLGGHSLMATQALSRVRGALRLEAPLRDLFEAPTVAGFAARLAGRQPVAPARSIPPLRARSLAADQPLSHAQERLWFLDQLDPGSASYNIPVAFHCEGLLQPKALEQFLNELIRRHAALRTTFNEVAGRPVQRVHPHLTITVTQQSLADIAAEDRPARTQSLALAEALRPFSLATGPLIRATLLAISPVDHVLLLTIHHIVADGWSMGVLMREFSQLYPALAQGRPSPLPELEIQYPDFAVWQREWLTGDHLQGEFDYWQRQLGGAPKILELPADHPRPPVQTFRGATHRFHLPKAEVDALKALSQEAGASLFMTLFAGFAVLIHRHTGLADFLIGSPIANRNHQAIEPLIGFFVNTLALRADLNGDPTFAGLLERVRHMTLEAFAHQDVPFEYLVERLQPLRDMMRNPLVQVSFIFQNAPFSAVEIEGLKLRQLTTESGTARFDLEVFLWEEGGAINGSFAYYRDIFEPDTIARLAGNFETVLRGLLAQPKCPVSELPLLSPAERQLVLEDWNATVTPYPTDKTVHDLFAEQVAAGPDRLAVTLGAASFTYAELDQRSNLLARYLQALGAGPGTLVGLCLDRELDLPTAILGVLKAGAAYLPLDPAYPDDRLAFMIADSGLGVLITQAAHLPRLRPGGARVLCLAREWEHVAQTSAGPLPERHDPKSLVYVIYTSGSTGRPKGVLLEHRNVVNYLYWAREYYAVGPGGGAPVNSSISFDATVTSLITPLIAGGRVELLPEAYELEHLCAALQSDRDFSLVKITPAHLDVLANLLPPVPFAGKARAFVIGGEALTGRHLAYWRAHAPQIRYINEYGPTETVVGCCIYEVPPAGEIGANIPIGHPIANTRMYVLDARLQPVPVGVVGELYIGGAGVGRGYLRREELTAERFVADPYALAPGGRMYKTGDAARYLPDGTLEFLGRLDSQVKLRGYRIELGEIELVLAAHPAVERVALLLREDQPGDQRLVAYVVPRDTLEDTGPNLAGDQVSQWNLVFQESYGSARLAEDATFDLAGWKSSYTGTDIPAEEMRVWVEETVAAIRACGPRRVWEIGCGTGLLLARIAPGVESYLGTDFSQTALTRVQGLLPRDPRFRNVQLAHRAAHDLTGITGPFDTIIINSVVQYFPSRDYLELVLNRAAAHLAPGGRIFLGDLRSLPLLEAFHASVELAHAGDSLPVGEWRKRIAERIAREEELVLAPQYLASLPARLPGCTLVEVKPKRGRYENELSCFRFDAILHFGGSAEVLKPGPWLDWTQDQLSLAQLRATLEQARPAQLAVRHVPNARLEPLCHLLRLGRSAVSTQAVGHVRAALAGLPASGVAPDDLYDLAAAVGYTVELALSDDPAGLDVVFQRPVDGVAAHKLAFWPVVAAPAAGQRWVNNPLAARLQQKMGPELRRLAESQLPDYMVPANFVLLPDLPLTANGKLDRAALPAPLPRVAVAAQTVAPRQPEEEVLVAIWEDILGLERIGTTDDFFALGGHSLLATQMISRVREAFGVELQVRSVFEAPTIAALAQRIIALRDQARQTPDLPPLVPRPADQPVPLSFAQERLWFLDLLEEKSPAYNMPATLRLAGELDPERLRRAIQEIVNRHETLRTTFSRTPAGEPRVEIHPALEFALPLLDLSAVPEAARQSAVQAATAAVVELGFDLSRGPLLRAQLIRLADREHLLLTCMHHIIADGWSMGVFIREFVESYTALAEGRPPRLEPLPIQYADYAIWQRAWLAGEVLRSQLAYWQERLAGAPPLLDLPVDFPRPATMGFAARHEMFELERPLGNAVAELARQHGVSLYMTLLSGFALLLSRHSRELDVVVGSPIAGRRFHESEPLIGFFANTLALRVDLAGDPSFVDLLKRVRQTALDAYTHQDAPFELVVEALNPQRSLRHAPVFQVMFALQNAPEGRLALPGLTTELQPNEWAAAKFDLTLYMGRGENGLWGSFEYRTDLFLPATIQTLIRHWHTLWQGIVANPALPLSRYALLDTAERRRVLQLWNPPGTPALPWVDLTCQVAAQAVATPLAIAVEAATGPCTYQELEHLANQLAHALTSRGIGPGQRVAICQERGLPMLVSVLAVLKAGAAYVPLDPNYPADRLAYMLTDSAVNLLITETSLAALLPEGAPRLIVDAPESRAALAAAPVLFAGPPLQPDDLAYQIYTSGSTGRPKGIAMRHAPLSHLIQWQLAQAPGASPGRTLQFTSLSFDVSFQEIFATWCAGGTLVLIDEARRRDPRALVAHLREQRVDRLYLPFVALQQLALAAASLPLEGLVLRDIITAGEQLKNTRELAAFLQALPGCRLHNHYGPAETHVVTAFTLPADVSAWTETPPIGSPAAGARIYLLDESLEPVPPGVRGEIYIGGDTLAAGYWNQPAATAARFLPDPFALHPGARMYRTGDLGTWSRAGVFEFAGRVDDQVKIRGFRVEPGEIEAVIAALPGVGAVAVVARPSTLAGHLRLVAYVVPQARQVLEEAALRALTRRTLPDYMTPERFVFLEALPLTPSGKLNRRALPAPDCGALVAEHYVVPRDPVELRLALLWEEILERPRIGIHEDFFDLGGHSLLAVRLMARIEQAWGVPLPLATLFQHASVARLAARLRQPAAETGPAACLIPLQPAGTRPPLFLVPGAGGSVLYLIRLARQLGLDQPFYGLQAPGLDGREAPAASVEAMAAVYAREIMAACPAGPCFVGGHSFGATIAFETARQLTAAGRAVARLVILDANAPQTVPVPAGADRDDADWLAEILLIIGELSGGAALPSAVDLRALDADGQLAAAREHLLASGWLPPDTTPTQVRAFLEVYKAHLRMHYQPGGPIPAPVSLLKARRPVDPAAPGLDALLGHNWGWDALTLGPVEVAEVTGSHLTMMTEPHVQVTAEALRRCLRL